MRTDAEYAACESPVLQAVMDAIAGTLDPHTQIADHPNVKFAQMQRLKLTQQPGALGAQHWKPGRNEARQLKRAGYDGLYFPGECACLVEDLYPCGERQEGCRPGFKKPCDCYEHDWHIGEREAK